MIRTYREYCKELRLWDQACSFSWRWMGSLKPKDIELYCRWSHRAAQLDFRISHYETAHNLQRWLGRRVDPKPIL